MLMDAYEGIRLRRGAQIYRAESSVLEFVNMPNGPAQQARDEAMRAALKQALRDWDNEDEDVDEFLRQTWEEWIHIFDYDEQETIEDWWLEWGNLMHSGDDDEESERNPVMITMSVST
ncbi:hypothetical protein GLOTRDRAFT_131223 [Gloeophyllum trabeum ATCC 11539]|uniref:Uncharacterized protein n=1 Tax=Gloeophyllum trabeum (strain ATCC 11539 / FP-39264 / Madison 617) TaxID=670483 RepID=S7PZ60_GLOTA|nr:uncharacterized protein GLOTRDRAFT_131223 [Gloeophyllum trabeum ATCC 11539]EPQ52936.1 hypothetical protein GLOTRDRAFT_131223 [Gloeophyllum trabeum ATCC 11539]